MASAITPRPENPLAELLQPARWIRAVGVWQILGGIAGAMTWFGVYRRISEHYFLSDLILLLAIFIALASILLGVGLVKRRAGAVVPSLFVQALQLVGFSTGDLVYQFTLGPYFDVMILWWHRLSIIAGFAPRLTLRVNVQAAGEAGVAIDLFACFCFWMLLWYEPTPAADEARGAIPPSA
jgi:hypothetical protein